MPKIRRKNSALLVVDFQSRLMPAIEDGTSVIANAQRLLAGQICWRCRFCSQNKTPKGLVAHWPSFGLKSVLRPEIRRVAHKMTFDACRAECFMQTLPPQTEVIVSGCEAHVCVLQTVMGLLSGGRRVFIVRDAVGSRRAESKEIAIGRMERNGAEVVTTEMVLFEWLEIADDPRLNDMIALVK